MVSQNALQVSRYTPNGEVEVSEGSQVPHLRGSPGPHLGEWVSRPDTGGGCIPGCAETDTPPPLPQQTATAAGGTHPTGMHSCSRKKLVNNTTLSILHIPFNSHNYNTPC